MSESSERGIGGLAARSTTGRLDDGHRRQPHAIYEATAEVIEPSADPLQPFVPCGCSAAKDDLG